MEHGELMTAIEAVVFVAPEPVAWTDVQKIFTRLWAPLPEAERQPLMQRLGQAWEAFLQHWSVAAAAPAPTDVDALAPERGFVLAAVAGGVAFRSHPRHAEVLRAMREERPQRLSKPALETLAIVAYRQPVTKPEVDHVRGVDCGGTLKVLLERNLIRIVGKKEEVGRPSLYGTTREFLNLFNLANLTELPSLREFHELNDDAAAQVQALDGETTLEELSQSAKQLRLAEEPAVMALQEAVESLENTESKTRDAFIAEGIAFAEESDAEAVPAAAQPSQCADEATESSSSASSAEPLSAGLA